MKPGLRLGRLFVALLLSTSVLAMPGAVAADSGPILTVPGGAAMVDEGQQGTFYWGIVDDSPDYPYSVRVDWGDGSSQDFTTSESVPQFELTHVYAAADANTQGGTLYSPTLTLTDAVGVTVSASQPVYVMNLAPVLTAPASIEIAEGPMVWITLATFTDASVGPWEVYVWRSDGGALNQTFTTPGAIVVGWDPGWGSQTAHVSVFDRGGLYSEATISVVVSNSAPVVQPISLELIPDGQPTEGGVVFAWADFTDPGLSDTPIAETYTCTIDFGDGSGPQPGRAGPGLQFGGPGRCAGVEGGHTYASPGTYTILITVSDSNGGTGTQARTVTVANVAPQVGPIEVWPEGTSMIGQELQIAAQIADPGLGTTPETYTCTIDFGDGTSAQGPGIDNCWWYHTYTQAGEYTVTETVTDSNGGIGTSSRTIAVYSAPPWIDYVTVDPVLEGTPTLVQAAFNNPESAVEATSCTIDYGDGVIAAGKVSGQICSGSHAYAQPGFYLVMVTVTDASGGTASSWAGAEVDNASPTVYAPVLDQTLAGVVTAASASFSDPGLAGETYTCTIDYGDGAGPEDGTVTEAGLCQGPSHTYAGAGTYVLTAAVSDSSGGTGTYWQTVTISSPEIAVGAIDLPASISEGTTVTASAPFAGFGDQTYECLVDYGDNLGWETGTIEGSTCLGPSHTYGRPGPFIVSVMVSGSMGVSGSATATLTVENVAPVITSLSVPSLVKLGSSVTATATFVDPGIDETYGVSFEWMDGTRTDLVVPAGAREVSASHTYAKAGMWAVYVTIADADMASTGSSINVYDPARVLAGYGSFYSPAGACSLAPQCAAASTATFSTSVKYARGATRPTVSFTMKARGLNVTATGGDFLIVQDGIAYVSGTVKVNGVGGYRLWIATRDGRPDWIAVQITDKAGNDVYNSGTQNLRSGYIVVK